MSWRNELTVGLLRAERLFYGTSNGGLGSELSTTELGWLDGITPGTAAASKALVLDANADITSGIRNLNIDGDLSSDQDITAGVDDTTYGRIYIYGGNADQGGFMRLYTGADHDDDDEFFAVNVTSALMWIGAENDLDQMIFYGSAAANGAYAGTIATTVDFEVGGDFNVTGTVTLGAGLELGSDGAVGSSGSLTVYGDSTTVGGLIDIYNANGEDDDVEYYRIEADADLKIYADSTEILNYSQNNSAWSILDQNVSIENDLDVEGGSLGVGDSGTVRGEVALYGDPTGTAEGGKIFLHTADDHDGTIAAYWIEAYQDDLWISPDGSETEQFGYNGGSAQWEFDSASPVYFDCDINMGGQMHNFDVGDGTLYGRIRIDGDPTGSDEGGKIQLETGDDHDDTINAYWLEVFEDDFWIAPDGSETEQFGYRGGSAQWNFDSANAVYFDCPIEVAEHIVSFDVRSSSGSDGQIDLMGALTGASEGGRINFHLADDDDGSLSTYNIQAYGQYMYIGSALTENMLELLDDGETVQIEVQSGVTFNIDSGATFQLGGDDVDATASELNTKEFTVKLEDLSSGGVAYIACPVAGTVTRVDSVVTGDPGGVSTTTLSVNGGAGMTATLVIANGAAAGERDTAAPSDNNTVAAGDAIYLTFDSTPTNAVDAYVTVTVTL